MSDSSPASRTRQTRRSSAEGRGCSNTAGTGTRRLQSGCRRTAAQVRHVPDVCVGGEHVARWATRCGPRCVSLGSTARTRPRSVQRDLARPHRSGRSTSGGGRHLLGIGTRRRSPSGTSGRLEGASGHDSRGVAGPFRKRASSEAVTSCRRRGPPDRTIRRLPRVVQSIERRARGDVDARGAEATARCRCPPATAIA